jgi:hypothetical protein
MTTRAVVHPPERIGWMFTMKESEGPNGGPGRTIGFTDVHIVPRSYAELAKARLHQKVTLPLEMLNGRILDTDIEGVDVTKYANMKTVLESPFTSHTVGLVRGGWLPSFLAATNPRATLLLDRNAVTELASRFNGGVTTGRTPDFLDMFAGQPVRLNPLLYAIEGNARSAPDAVTMARELADAVSKLRNALPDAVLMVGPESVRGAMGLIADTSARMACEARFLLRIAGLLNGPTARANMDARWDDVLQAADDCGVAREALVVLAALSVVVVPNGRSIARRLLKFGNDYSEAHAYNALSDLRSLDLLIKILGIYPEELTQLCTADRPLALFWCGIQVADITLEGGRVTYTLSPVEALLPGDTLDKWLAMIAAYNAADS